MKSWNELTFSDNYLFCKILENEELCRELIEILLNIKISKIEYIKSERQIEPGFDSKGIRLDVYLEDSDKIYDIEMQTSNYKNLPLRVRYYQAAMDISKVKKRNKINEFKETYILFICKDDPFNLGLPVYTISHRIDEAPQGIYNDKTHRVFYNCSAYNSEKNKKLKGFLEYISTQKANTDFSRKLETLVTEAKTKNDWEDSYMFLSTWLEDELETGYQNIMQKGLKEGMEKGIQQGIEKGIEKGIQQGIQQGMEQGVQQGRTEGINSEKIRIAKEMYFKNIPLNTIMEITGLQETEIINN